MKKNNFFTLKLLSGMLIIFVLLFTSTVGILSFNKNNLKNIFVNSIINNLNSYSTHQIQNNELILTDVNNTLENFSTLFKELKDVNLIKFYISSLNNYSFDETTFYYFTKEEFEKSPFVDKLDENFSSPNNFLELNKENFLIFSKPIFINENFEGIFLALINANSLSKFSREHNWSYGTIEKFLIIDNNGKIIHSNKTFNATDLLDILVDYSLSEETENSLKEVLSSTSNNLVIRLGEKNNIPYYLTLSSFNELKFVTIFKATAAVKIMYKISFFTTASIGIIIVLIILLFVTLYVFDKKQQEKIAEYKHRYVLLEKFTDTILFEYNFQKDIMYFTENAHQIIKLPSTTQRNFLDKLSEEYIFLEDISKVKNILTGKILTLDEVRVRLYKNDSDEYSWFAINFEYIYEKDLLSTVVGKVVDIHKIKKNEEFLFNQSQKDLKTGLLNKLSTEEIIENILKQDISQRCALIIVDIDNLKVINDTLGHIEGDRAISSIADTIRSQFRSSDILGRIGGDEFIVFLRNISLETTLVDTLKSFMNKISYIRIGKENDIPINCSIGISFGFTKKSNFHTLYEQADSALYKVKKGKKNNFAFYEEKE